MLQGTSWSIYFSYGYKAHQIKVSQAPEFSTLWYSLLTIEAKSCFRREMCSDISSKFAPEVNRSWFSDRDQYTYGRHAEDTQSNLIAHAIFFPLDQRLKSNFWSFNLSVTALDTIFCIFWAIYNHFSELYFLKLILRPAYSVTLILRQFFLTPHSEAALELKHPRGTDTTVHWLENLQAQSNCGYQEAWKAGDPLE